MVVVVVVAVVVRPSSFVLRPSSFVLRPSSFVLRPSSFVVAVWYSRCLTLLPTVLSSYNTEGIGFEYLLVEDETMTLVRCGVEHGRNDMIVNFKWRGSQVTTVSVQVMLLGVGECL